MLLATSKNEKLTFDVRFNFVATLVEHFKALSNMLCLCLIFYGFVKYFMSLYNRFGALYTLLGFCLIFHVFV